MPKYKHSHKRIPSISDCLLLHYFVPHIHFLVNLCFHQVIEAMLFVLSQVLEVGCCTTEHLINIDNKAISLEVFATPKPCLIEGSTGERTILHLSWESVTSGRGYFSLEIDARAVGASKSKSIHSSIAQTPFETV